MNTTVKSAALLYFALVQLLTVQAQVKIGDNPEVIDPASILELESNTRALVLTRVSDTQMLAMAPLQGAMVYNIDQKCIFYFDAEQWQNLCNGGVAGVNASLVDNGNNTYTFTDSNGEETLITINTAPGGALEGEPGAIFFAGDDGAVTENTNELFWDTTTNSLGIGAHTTVNHKVAINGDLGATQILVNDANQEATPIIIRGSGADQRLVSFQDENLGNTLFNINFRGAGLNIDEINKPHRLFIKILGGMGIETREPTETLDVAGTLRIRELEAALPSDNIVTVDANGVFHRSANTSNKTLTLGNTHLVSAKWTNASSNFALNKGANITPIFAKVAFHDNAKAFNADNEKILRINSNGRYQIVTNLSLKGSNSTENGEIATISARIFVNNKPYGAWGVAANNGSTNREVLFSIHINEIIPLTVGDIVTIRIITDTKDKTLYVVGDSSNCTFIKLK